MVECFWKGGDKMPDEVKFFTFPQSRIEALAMLYLQSQDLTGKSPSEIQSMYFEALYELERDFRDKRSSGWFKKKIHGED